MFNPDHAFVTCPACDANASYVHHVTRDEWACDACGESFTGPASVVTGTDSGELRTPRRRTRETRR